eukprot:CAMPEP_0201570966 /NCGR_PEP_ID=MMETSP0190_2-20130828/13463_1 /ASSEMBLY_ACC=CAM_ASM_000263 /TAXON_ID=37353 /ORGANISM="Rosalina sp." /LENGTH=88 /DNA_ID=CAMNT_0047995085 /DNA_START=916 /DNA_END=1182 /DNA_ORIENTATION=-
MGMEYANKSGNQMEIQNDTITTDNGMVLHLHDYDAEDQSTQSVPTQSATSTMGTGKTTPLPTTNDQPQLEITMDAECVEVTMVEMELH